MLTTFAMTGSAAATTWSSWLLVSSVGLGKPRVEAKPWIVVYGSSSQTTESFQAGSPSSVIVVGGLAGMLSGV